MEKFTVKNFRSIANRNNIRGYSKLRKEALQTLLINRLPREFFEREIAGRGDEFSRSLLDDDIPEMSQQSLKPTQYVPPPEKEEVTQTLGRWLDWLTRFVPEPVKRPINHAFNAFKKKVMSLFPKQLKFEQSKRSALKGFVEEHIIKATNQTIGPKTFLLAVKQIALEKFQSQTKVRLALKARMEKVSPTDGNSIVEIRNFLSKTVISWNPPTWMNSGLK